MHFLQYILFLSLFSFNIAKDTVPTFLLDYDKIMSELFFEQSPFGSMSSEQFTNIVQNAIRQYAAVILIVEETFSTEDVSTKDERGTPFVNLRDEMVKNNVKYIPNVETPMKVITNQLQPMENNIFVIKPGQLFHSGEFMKYFYLTFKDDKNETRADALRRHDLIIQHVYETTRKRVGGPVLAIYTGKVNPVTIHTRGAIRGNEPYAPVDKGIILISPFAKYRFVGMTIDTEDRNRRSFFEEDHEILRGNDEVSEDVVKSKIPLGDYELEFFFHHESDRWRLSRIKLYEGGDSVGDRYLSTYISAPFGRSYFCDDPLVIYNTRIKTSVVIPKYQIQTFRPGEGTAESSESIPEDSVPDDSLREGSDTTHKSDPIVLDPLDKSDREFGPIMQCAPYFTIGILMGLTVTFLCLSILLSGVFCLYHCETNDRFDDPQGKTIFVAVTGD